MTDLCWVCQQNSTAIMRAANTPTEEKSEVNLYQCLTYILKIHKIVKRAEEHLLSATKARSYLKSQVQTAKEEIKKNFLDKGAPIPPLYSSLPAASHVMDIHYSFDFAQQVSLKGA